MIETLAGSIETGLYDLSQWFLLPVLLAVALLFGYAFVALGGFFWQWRQRRAGAEAGFELERLQRARPALGLGEIEAHAVRRLEAARIASRVTPLLGLVATMIPMGPALKGLADGNLAEVSRGLMVAFSAVILALIASALTFWVVSVRRRWYAEELLRIERRAPGAQGGVAAELPA